MALAAYNLSQPGSSTLTAPFCVVTSLPPAIETPEVVRMATRLCSLVPRPSKIFKGLVPRLHGSQSLVSEPDPRKIEKEGLAHRLGWKCTLRPV